MDEQQYKSTYSHINPKQCVFEKAINSRVCNCVKSQRFNLADREGVACNSAQGLERCSMLISQLRNNARFVFQRTEASQVLPHAQEIKIQNGGLIGLQSLLHKDAKSNVEDIDGLLTLLVNKYEHFDQIPYSQLMHSISSYQARSRRKKSDKK